MATTTTPPVVTGRLEAVDTARGVALVSMMLVHLAAYWVDIDPPWAHVVVGGRAAPLFAMLAGVALTIVHDRDPRGAGSVRATWIRAVLLVALGLTLGSLRDLPVLVILAFYGVLVVAALPFRRLSTRVLLAVAAAWALAAPIVLVGARIAHAPVDAGQAELSDLQRPTDLVAELVLWGAYPAGVWFAYVLVGLAVGRLDLRRPDVARRLVAVGAALVVTTLGLGRLLIGWGAVPDPDDQRWRLLFVGDAYPYRETQWRDLLLVGQHTSTPLNVLSATGSALLVIGVCALLVRPRWGRRVMAPLGAAGAMTLTLYTTHVLWTWLTRRDYFDVQGLAPGGSYRDWAVQVVVLCAAALLWRRLVGKGPLEWVVRRASVWSTRAWKRA